MSEEQQLKEAALLQRISELETENTFLRKHAARFLITGNTVSVPEKFAPVFEKAQDTVKAYFKTIDIRPEKGTIEINGDRYVLVRAATLSIDFFQKLLDLYADRGKAEAIAIGKNFLFDMAHVIGLEDAKNFHKIMNLTDPVEKPIKIKCRECALWQKIVGKIEFFVEVEKV